MKKYLLTVLVLSSLSVSSYSFDFSFDLNSDEGVYIAQSSKSSRQADSYRTDAYRKLDEAKTMLGKKTVLTRRMNFFRTPEKVSGCH